MVHLRTAELIRKYYRNNPAAHQLLLEHSRLVTRKALAVARRLTAQTGIDLDFVAEAAILHDIGMIYTHAPELHCHGDLPYLAHGVKGAEILRAEGLPRHARVCERHTGVGLSAAEIHAQKLPLPLRDLQPESLEEQLICYADLFYSKNRREHGREKTAGQIMAELAGYGADKGAIFERWHRQFRPVAKDDIG